MHTGNSPEPHEIDQTFPDTGARHGATGVVVPHTGPIRVLLVDDQPYLGPTLRRAFENAGGIDLLEQRLRPGDLVSTVKHLCPDVVLIDYWIPGADIAGEIADLLRACPGAAIVVYTAILSAADRELLLDSGIIACIGKYEPTTSLIQAIHEAAAYARAQTPPPAEQAT